VKLLYIFSALATASIALLIYSTVWFVEWYTKEPITKYEIVTPTRQKEREILEKPSIKVRALLQD
jgi:hypothetical protein